MAVREHFLINIDCRRLCRCAGATLRHCVQEIKTLHAANQIDRADSYDCRPQKRQNDMPKAPVRGRSGRKGESGRLLEKSGASPLSSLLEYAEEKGPSFPLFVRKRRALQLSPGFEKLSLMLIC